MAFNFNIIKWNEYFVHFTPIANDLNEQEQDYPKAIVFSARSAITPLTFVMAHRLGENMLVDDAQYSLQK